MNLKFEIATISYITAEFRSDNNNIKIGVSGLYEDKFQDLLNIFYLIYCNQKEKSLFSFPYKAEVLWKDDFVYYQWVISKESIISGIHIKIVELYPKNSEYKKVLIDKEFDIKTLFDNIFKSLHTMYIEFGFLGYKYNWDVGNFPIGEYLLFKSDRLDLSLETKDDEDGWKHKISNELNLLNINT